jgi:mRNA interferase RelE/StbE
MEIKFSKNSIKFLNKLPSKNQEQIREKILYLLNDLENQQLIPFQQLDIKKLKGNWQGFFRMRVGKIRVIFTIQDDFNELLVYEIDFRGDVYK